jgi:hypothetical protein
MEPDRTWRFLSWTFCITFSTRVSSQTDFLIASHVDRTRNPNSPDLNPCDYFLWGFLKEKIFPKMPQTVLELRAQIIQTCNETTEDMCRRVIITIRVEGVARHNGGHIEHVSHRG